MENFINNLGWKKMAAIMIFFSLAALVFIVISFSSSLSTKSDTTITPKPTQNSGSRTEGLTGLGSNKPKSTGWKEYDGQTFQVQYPSNLALDTGQADDGSIFTKFVSLDGKIKIFIDSFNGANTPVSKLSNLFNLLQYREEQSSIVGLPARKFSGSVKITGAGTTQEIVYILQKGDLVYKLQLSYVGTNVDPQIEQTFYQMITTLQLQ